MWAATCPAAPVSTLLAWSQGEVRHNVLGDAHRANPEATPENKRRLLAVGWILETEFSFPRHRACDGEGGLMA
ncbi:MAG: hypothetical protein WDM96_13475 [Lacunisphaera sp.]